MWRRRFPASSTRPMPAVSHWPMSDNAFSEVPMAAGTPPFIVAIPARHASTRLPGKPLRDLGGRPLISRVVQRAQDAGAAQVVVATDDERIGDALHDSGALVCMTRADHVSGSDRLAECAER